MRKLVVVVGLMVAGCSNPAKDAERQYEMVEKTGNKAEICKAAKKVEQAYLEAGNQQRYSDWRLRRDINCLTAEVEAN